MRTCEYCGGLLEEGVNTCSKCGAKVNPPVNQNVQPNQQQVDYMAKLQELNNTPDTTGEYDKNDIEQNKIMAVLAYFGILVLVPILAAKESKFARFHANQGLVLTIGGFAYGIISAIASAIAMAISKIFFFIPLLLSLVSLAIFVLSIIGIVNAVQGKAKELPIIGKIKILK